MLIKMFGALKGWWSALVFTFAGKWKFIKISYSLPFIFLILGLIGIIRLILEINFGIIPYFYIIRKDVIFVMFIFPIYLTFFGSFCLHYLVSKFKKRHFDKMKLLTLAFYLQILHLIVPILDHVGINLLHFPVAYQIFPNDVVRYLILKEVYFTPGIIVVWILTLIAISRFLVRNYKLNFSLAILVQLITFHFIFWPTYILFNWFNFIFDTLFNIPFHCPPIGEAYSELLFKPPWCVYFTPEGVLSREIFWGWGLFYLFVSLLSCLYFRKEVNIWYTKKLNKIMIRSKELKIFLVFFIIYSFFVHWVGWNENSRFALVKAIVDEQRFEIDSFANQTGDKSFYNSHYYTDKPPGGSFLATPIYYIWKSFHNFFLKNFEESSEYIKEKADDMVTFLHLKPSFFTRVSMLLVVIFTSCLPGALSVVFFYKLLSKLCENKNFKYLATLAYGLGSPIFPFSTVFFGNIAATFFSFLSFYLIFKFKHKLKYHFISGLLAGFALVIEHNLGVLFLGCLVLSLFYKRKFTKYFVFGSLVGILPLLLYNFSIFGNPFRFTFEYVMLPFPETLKKETFPEYVKLFLSISNPLITLPQILFLPYRGLFFFWPVLIFSFLGLRKFHKKFKLESTVILTSFLVLIIFNSFHPRWWGGSSFGPRYLVPIVPFLALYLAFLEPIFIKRKIFKMVFIFLLALSIFHNFVGLQPYENYLATYQKWFEKPKLYLRNVIYEYYLPKFLEDGPRSRIFESIIYDFTKVDIRDFVPMPVKEIKLLTISPFGILTLKVPFLIIPVIIIVITIIFKHELFNIFFKKLPVGLILFSLALLIFISRLSFNSIVYGAGFYPTLENESVKWMGESGTIYLYSLNQTKAIINISITSFLNRTLDLYLNNKFIESYRVASSIVQPILLDKGENILHLISKDGCKEPYKLIENSSDFRCLSVGIKEINVIQFDELKKSNKTFIYGSNWYDVEIVNNKERRLMSQNATIFILSPHNRIKLNLTVETYKKPRTLNIFLNDKLVDSYLVNNYFTHILTPEIELGKDLNILRLESKDGCDVPAIVENSSDQRCLSFGLSEISEVTFEELIEKNNTIVFGKYWYPTEYYANKSFRWFSQSATIFLLSESNSFNLTFFAKSYHLPKHLKIILNGKHFGTYLIPTYGEILELKLDTKVGENVLELYSEEGCEIPSKIENSSDERCISFAVGDFNQR